MSEEIVMVWIYAGVGIVGLAVLALVLWVVFARAVGRQFVATMTGKDGRDFCTEDPSRAREDNAQYIEPSCVEQAKPQSIFKSGGW